jgi:hypothetical protein
VGKHNDTALLFLLEERVVAPGIVIWIDAYLDRRVESVLGCKICECQGNIERMMDLLIPRL